MKKETKLLIGELLLKLEGSGILWTLLKELDVSDSAYLEAKQDFNRSR